MTLATFVREARERRGSLRGVAEALGISPSSLSRIENGHPRQVSAETLARLFDHLGLDRWEGFRLAEMTDPELEAMVRAPSRALAELLRAGASACDDDWNEVLRAVKAARARRETPSP